jgi:CHAD domain-containing protein
MVEHETKLSVDPEFRLPDLSGHPLPRRVFTSTYFDSLDHCLARSMITLRYRMEGRSGAWQLKLPLNGARREIELQGAAGNPPGLIVEALVVLLEGKHLVPVSTLRTWRTGVRVHQGKDRAADVVVDTVSVLEDGRVVHQFREIEIEWSNSEEEFIDGLIAALHKAGARSHDGRPKLFRALSLPFNPPEAPAGDAPVQAQLRHNLSRQVQALKRFDPGVRLGGEIEDLHQMRVAVRRMRTVLRAVHKLVDPEWAEPLISGLAWLGRLLGLARDLDVQMEYFRGEAEQLKTRDRRPLERFLLHLLSERRKAQQTLLDEMKSARYLGFLSILREAAQAPAMVHSKYTLSDVAAGQFDKLRKSIRKLKPSPSNADLHRVRIKTKRARYAAELAEATGGKPVTRFIKTAQDFQDLLGTHQDALLAERYVGGLLKYQTGERAAFTAGLLVSRARQRRETVREEFWPAWKRLKKRGNQAWR